MHNKEKHCHYSEISTRCEYIYTTFPKLGLFFDIIYYPCYPLKPNLYRRPILIYYRLLLFFHLGSPYHQGKILVDIHDKYLTMLFSFLKFILMISSIKICNLIFRSRL